ncbi:MAG: acetyl-CoA carboxylase biotin carboxyl carrier protein [Chloroflexi bacterium]|nr:acetyl-CoA carboxylase biotin carboxyl carrier protein [Chloroflexota bacterium]
MGIDVDLKELIRLTSELGVTELRVERGDVRIHIRRQPAAGAVEVTQTPAQTPVEPAPIPDRWVRSPLVGRFYWSAEGAEGLDRGEAVPLVVGQALRDGQRVGFVETMRVMNEVVADVGGVVLEVLVEAGQPVEYSQPLLRLRPVPTA